MLYTFTGHGGTGDGADPTGGVIVDSSGALFGTTEGGGEAGLGTVFALLPPNPNRKTWQEEIIYDFPALTEGGAPEAGLIFGKNGVLYGTTSGGGAANSGTAFQLQFQSGQWIKTTLWSFDGSNGSQPWSPVTLVGDSLYGTTLWGGTSNLGTVYQLRP